MNSRRPDQYLLIHTFPDLMYSNAFTLRTFHDYEIMRRRYFDAGAFEVDGCYYGVVSVREHDRSLLEEIVKRYHNLYGNSPQTVQYPF